jgi:phosphoglycolate phosphatase
MSDWKSKNLIGIQKIGLIFDLDGTLFRVETVTVPAVKTAFKSLGLAPPTKNRILSGIGKVTQRFYQELLPEGKRNLASVLQTIGSENEILLLRQGKGQLYSGTKKVLGHLRDNGYHLGLISNSSYKYFREIIQAFSLAPFFSHTLCAGETKGFQKRDLIRRIGNLLGGTKAIVIGDRKEDILAAKENGLKSVGCLYGYGSREELEAAEWKIEKIKDLISIFAP